MTLTSLIIYVSLADFLESTKMGGDIFASITFGWGSLSLSIIIATTRLNLFPFYFIFKNI